jgi:hypothetical protein
LKCAAHPGAKELRLKLANKQLPLNSSLRQRIFNEIENEKIVSLLELYITEFLVSTIPGKRLVAKVGFTRFFINFLNTTYFTEFLGVGSFAFYHKWLQ